MQFPIINFNHKTPKETRKATLINLRRWMISEKLSLFKKELLETAINFAENRFVNFSLKTTNQNRMAICENIFKLAIQPDQVFLRSVLQEINNITELKSELRNTLLSIYAKYSAQLQNVDLTSASLHAMADSASSITVANINNQSVPPVFVAVNVAPVASENSQALIVAPRASIPLREAAPLIRRNSQALLAAPPADQNQRQPNLDSGLFNNLIDAGNRMFTSSSVMRRLLTQPIPIRGMSDAPVANLDKIIKAFQDETARLKQRDFNVLILTCAAFSAICLSLKYLNIIEDRTTRISISFAICVGMNYLLSWNRSQLLDSQQRKLTYLFSQFKRLTERSPANTNNPQVIKIFRAIAPYLQHEELSPWASVHSSLSERFAHTSDAFNEILEQPPHYIYAEKPKLKSLSMGHIATAAFFGVRRATDIYVDEVKTEAKERLKKRMDENRSLDIAAFKDRLLYGRPSLDPNPAQDEMNNQQAVVPR